MRLIILGKKLFIVCSLMIAFAATVNAEIYSYSEESERLSHSHNERSNVAPAGKVCFSTIKLLLIKRGLPGVLAFKSVKKAYVGPRHGRKQWVNVFDENKDGVIDLEEFIAAKRVDELSAKDACPGSCSATDTKCPQGDSDGVGCHCHTNQGICALNGA